MTISTLTNHRQAQDFVDGLSHTIVKAKVSREWKYAILGKEGSEVWCQFFVPKTDGGNTRIFLDKRFFERDVLEVQELSRSELKSLYNQVKKEYLIYKGEILPTRLRKLEAAMSVST